MDLPNTSLVSKCGIYCGACFVYRAFNDGGKFLADLSRELKVSKEEIRCNGCFAPTHKLWRNCKNCVISSCLEEKGYRFCYECSGFDGSCEKYEKIARLCSERGEDIRESLCRIEAGKTLAWLAEQDRKWRCSKCAGPISWYEKTCHHCGQRL